MNSDTFQPRRRQDDVKNKDNEKIEITSISLFSFRVDNVSFEVNNSLAQLLLLLTSSEKVSHLVSEVLQRRWEN